MSLLSDYLNARGVICVAITEEEDYHGEHKAPSTDDAPLYDLSVVYPDDIYTGRGSDYAQEPSERYGLAEVLRCHNKPWARVQVFRAVPKDIKGAKINPGDWVTLSRQYAKEHGLRSLGGPGKYKILTLNAYARDLYTNGDSLAEWGYNPRPATAEEEAEVSSLREAKDLERIKRASTGEKIISINKYPEDHYYGKPDEFFADLLAQRQATASEEIPDTISIDGVSRPTHNSKGFLIHPTTQGIENFWRWFGDSKVVDASGKPDVVYHGVGSAGTFKEFRKDLIGSSSGNDGHFGKGFYFSEDEKEAKIFSEQWRGTGDVLACYLRITKPFTPDTESLWSVGKKNPHLNVPDKIPVAIDGDDVENQLMKTNPKAGRIFHILRTHPDDAWDIIKKDNNGRIPLEPSSKILDVLNDTIEYLEPGSNREVREFILHDLKGIGITPKLIYGHRHELHMPYLTNVGEYGGAWTKALRGEGYDGVLGGEIVVFDESQIKAVDNTGAFSPDTTDITAAVNYQDDTDYATEHTELTKLGLIFGQPQSKNDGIQVTYKGHTLEIRPDKKEIELSPAIPASRGRKYVPASVKNVPGYAVTGITPNGSVTNVLRAEDAEKWLRGLKAYWDRKQ